MNDDSCNIEERTPLSLCYVCALIRPVIQSTPFWMETFLDVHFLFFIF